MTDSPPSLTFRQKQVLTLLSEGHTNQQIAGAIGLSHSRVVKIVSALRRKIPIRRDRDDRVELTVWWIEHRRDAA